VTGREKKGGERVYREERRKDEKEQKEVGL
jgi:hypothetical protein